jgi:hypothetical protein
MARPMRRAAPVMRTVFGDDNDSRMRDRRLVCLLHVIGMVGALDGGRQGPKRAVLRIYAAIEVRQSAYKAGKV